MLLRSTSSWERVAQTACCLLRPALGAVRGSNGMGRENYDPRLWLFDLSWLCPRETFPTRNRAQAALVIGYFSFCSQISRHALAFEHRDFHYLSMTYWNLIA